MGLRRRHGDGRDRGFAEVAIAGGVALAVGASVLGTGVATRVLDVSDGVTWLSGADGLLSRVNSGTGKPDFSTSVDACAGTACVVQQADGVVSVRDPKTGRLYVITQDDLQATREIDTQAGDDVVTLLTEVAALVVDRPAGDVTSVALSDGEATGGPPLSLGAPVGEAVVSGDRSAWLGLDSGQLVKLDAAGPAVVHRVTVGRGDDRVELSGSDDGGVTVLNAGTGVLEHIDPRGQRRTLASVPEDLATVAELPPVTRRDDRVVLTDVAGARVTVVQGGRLVDTVLDDRRGHALSPGVAFAGSVYVPDRTRGEVVVLDERGEVVRTISGGRPGESLEVFVDDGALWVNSSSSPSGIRVAEDGRTSQVEKFTEALPPPTKEPKRPERPQDAPERPQGAPDRQPLPQAAPVAPVPVGGGRSLGPEQVVAPGAPVLTVNPTNGGARMSWSPGAGGAPTSYVISVRGPGADRVPDEPATSTGRVLEGLENGETYTVSVTAVNTAGSARSVEVKVVPTADVPGTPTDLEVTAQPDASILVSFAEAKSLGRRIDSYRIDVAVQGAVVATETTSPGEATFDGLSPGAEHTVSVVALSDGVEGEPAEATVVPFTTPPAPVGFSAELVAGTQVLLRWSEPTSDGGRPVTGYEVLVDGAAETVPAGQTQHTMTQAAGTRRSYAVRALNEAGEGEPTEPQTIEAHVPPTVSAPSIASVSQSSVLVRFSVEWHGSGGASCSLVVVGVTAQPGGCGEIAAGGLYPGRDYTVYITATNVYGETSESSRAGFRTPWYRAETNTDEVPVNDAPRAQKTSTYTPSNPSTNYGYVNAGYWFDVACQVRGSAYYKNGYTSAGGYAYYWIKVIGYKGYAEGWVPAYFTHQGTGHEGSVPGLPGC